jgi:hypothetical protein
MADIGRSVGSQSIGLTIQTVAPGCRSSRRHRHVFQEEILIVMAGQGVVPTVLAISARRNCRPCSTSESGPTVMPAVVIEFPPRLSGFIMNCPLSWSSRR